MVRKSVRKQAPKVQVSTLVECLGALHLSSYVEGPFEDRGGLLLLAPPGSLKSTIVNMVADNYRPEARALSDVNVPKLVELRERIAVGEPRTLVFPELEKVYERDPRTAANVEGTLQALMAEGWREASYEKEGTVPYTARALVLAAMTFGVAAQHFPRWKEKGFDRRLLFSRVMIRDSRPLQEAVERWELLDFGVPSLPERPAQGKIPNLTTIRERQELYRWVTSSGQAGIGPRTLHHSLLVKMLAVLRWWYRSLGRTEAAAYRTLRSFSHTLGEDAAELVLDHRFLAANGKKRNKR